MRLGVDTTGMSGSTKGLADRFRENASSIVSVLVTGIWLAALLLGFDWWLPFMLFGYVAVVPIVTMLFDEDEETDDAADWQDQDWGTSGETQDSADDQSVEDALQTLRERYAKGELTDRQFEQKLERLLETETLEDAEDRHRTDRAAAEQDQEPTSEPDTETQADLETETE